MTDPDPISLETDLLWKIDIVNGMIAEDRESTIKDYLTLMAELKQIENAKIHLNEIYHHQLDARNGKGAVFLARE